MADTLSRLAGPQNVGSGTNTQFTGTAGHIYAIKSILIVNNSSSAISVKVGIGGVTDADLIIPDVTIPPGQSYFFDGLIVMSGAETLQTNASATGSTITVSGVDST